MLLCPAAPVPVDPFVGYERHALTASRLVMGQEALTKLGPSVQWQCNTDEDAVPVVCPPPTEHRLPWSGEALHPPNALTTTIYDSLGGCRGLVGQWLVGTGQLSMAPLLIQEPHPTSVLSMPKAQSTSALGTSL